MLICHIFILSAVILQFLTAGVIFFIQYFETDKHHDESEFDHDESDTTSVRYFMKYLDPLTGM